MTDSTRRTRGLRHGPRGAQVVEKVRAATLAELARAGFAGLTIDGVAKAAGVNRTTIYRRWPSKAALLAAMVEPVLERYDTDPDTGSVQQDLLALLLMIRDNTALPEGLALTEAVVASGGELHDLMRTTIDRAMAPFHRALERAVARGEMSAATDVRMIAYLAFHGVVMWEPTHESPPSDLDCARIARTVLGR
ncbi:TetR/AcrR family transcriptional regulator [Actinoplanes sp. NBC_00393]|uniref:TetR/AcrR family transcriptional regulator n=1 Tax=Actinoplanes sp. NBC_00393 TaxID=2975953 RepID=UPI002E1AA1E2